MAEAVTKTPIIATRDCGRCGGTGHYSYCERFGTKCFGCGGSGKVPCAPTGQKKIPTTAYDINKAKVGDIISISCVLYQVVRFKWIRLQYKGWDVYNQSVTVTRLIDGKTLYVKRAVQELDMEGFLSGKSYTGTADGVKQPAYKYVEPTAEMIGQVVEEETPVYDIVEEINGVAVVKVNDKFALRMRNEDGVFVYVPGYTKEYIRQRAASNVLNELTGEEVQFGKDKN